MGCADGTAGHPAPKPQRDPEDAGGGTPEGKALLRVPGRVGERSPADQLADMYGKPAGGHPWQPTSLKNILLSEAALGYLMHQGKPVIDQDGNPVRLCEGLWERPTHDALKRALIPRRTAWVGRRTNRDYLLTESKAVPQVVVVRVPAVSWGRGVLCSECQRGCGRTGRCWSRLTGEQLDGASVRPALRCVEVSRGPDHRPARAYDRAPATQVFDNGTVLIVDGTLVPTRDHTIAERSVEGDPQQIPQAGPRPGRARLRPHEELEDPP